MRNHPTFKSLRRGAFRGLAVVLVLFAASCAPRSYVLLLKNDDGSTGQVIVTGNEGQSTKLNVPGQGAALDGSTKTPFPVDQEKIDQDFGSALAAQPRAPTSFQLYFKFGSTQLTAESKELLLKVIEEIRLRPAPDVSIIGHSDTAGGAAQNETLSLARANETAGLLTFGGTNVREVTITSHGENNLLVLTPDNTSEPQNRRVEITIR